MTLPSVVEAITKNGMTGFFIVAIFFLNSKLDKQDEKISYLENKLYDCLSYSRTAQAPNSFDSCDRINYRQKLVAVLPNDPVGKIGKIKKKES